MKLYFSRNPNPRLAVAVARHLDANIDFEFASPLDPGQSGRFKPLNPNLLLPILERDDRYGRPMRSLATCPAMPVRTFGEPTMMNRK